MCLKIGLGQTCVVSMTVLFQIYFITNYLLYMFLLATSSPKRAFPDAIKKTGRWVCLDQAFCFNPPGLCAIARGHYDTGIATYFVSLIC